jgi:hypothetical protein
MPSFLACLYPKLIYLICLCDFFKNSASVESGLLLQNRLRCLEVSNAINKYLMIIGKVNSSFLAYDIRNSKL